MAYTQLSPIATPGKRYSFSAKGAAEAAERPEGTFTALSVLGVPGIIHSFLAKTVAAAVRRPKRSKEKTWLAQQAENQRFARLVREDNELLEIISTMITRGMLN